MLFCKIEYYIRMKMYIFSRKFCSLIIARILEIPLFRKKLLLILQEIYETIDFKKDKVDGLKIDRDSFN